MFAGAAGGAAAPRGPVGALMAPFPAERGADGGTAADEGEVDESVKGERVKS